MFNITWRINSFRSSPTRRINPSQYIRPKLIQVILTCQPNRVLIHKPPRLRLVILHQVVMQSSLFIIILILQSEQLMRVFVNPLILFKLRSEYLHFGLEPGFLALSLAIRSLSFFASAFQNCFLVVFHDNSPNESIQLCMLGKNK